MLAWPGPGKRGRPWGGRKGEGIAGQEEDQDILRGGPSVDVKIEKADIKEKVRPYDAERVNYDSRV